MTALELFEKMHEYGMVSYYWKHMLSLLEGQIPGGTDKDAVLKLFLLYFSLIDDGNVYMSLDQDILRGKIGNKIDGLSVQYEEEGDEQGEKANAQKKELNKIRTELEDACASVSTLSGLGDLIDTYPEKTESKLFLIRENRLFTRKFHRAVCKIRHSSARLFYGKSTIGTASFDYRKYMKPEKDLSQGQAEAVQKGLNGNLLITGGPGTGKTMSIFFLLLAILEQNPDSEIYLAAPSGKAAARMKESIQKCSDMVSDRENNSVKRILSLEEHTIHRLLGTDLRNGGFIYNAKNQFSGNSVFVIDESSMIDVCLFAALLEAIPDEARVFLLGDKDQLPSVECGAVFSDLLETVGKDNKVTLTESRRFGSNTKIYALAQAVHGTTSLPVEESEWKALDTFEVTDPAPKKETPIYYYKDHDLSGKEAEKIAVAWAKKFYGDFPAACEVEFNSPGELTDILKSITGTEERARILCANNTGVRGVEHINEAICGHLFKGKKKISGFYPGELVMITSNNHSLNLYNGDCGTCVVFKEAPGILYLMFKKETSLQITDGGNPSENRIFKNGEYIFYPAHLVSREDVVPAFAITIHKSQGSDYENILIFLPKKKGHPLLNRQIVYTAITRTSGSTYIISNQENLEHARNTVLTRDTGIL